MFVWDEVTGGRGSDEVASAIIKWVDLRQSEGQDFDVLRIFADNCAGQNKNINVVLAALRLIHAKKLFRVEFVYMISGHSFLPCDACFGVIEKKLRVNEFLFTTKDYIETIKRAQNPPFEVIPIEREDIKDVKSLGDFVTRRQTSALFSNACQIVCSATYKEGYLIKNDYIFEDLPTNVTECRLMKGPKNRAYSRKLFDLSEAPLPVKYQTDRQLNPNKLKDLRTMTNFVEPSAKVWFENLFERQRELEGTDATAIVEGEGEGEDEENDLLFYDSPTPHPPTASTY